MDSSLNKPQVAHMCFGIYMEYVCIPAVPWNIFCNFWFHASRDLVPQIQRTIVWIASWIPFKFCIWLKLRWHDMIKRFEWRSGAESFCELVTTTSAPLHNSTLGLIVEKKHLFMSEGSDVERWHLWLVLRPRQVEEAMLRQWVGEPGRCRLFCILLFQHFSLSFIQQIC